MRNNSVIDNRLYKVFPDYQNIKTIVPSIRYLDRIKILIESQSGFTFNEATRRREYVKNRQLFALVLKVFTPFSWKEIGLNIGNKDHATALWCVKQAINLSETYPQYKELAETVLCEAQKIFRMKIKGQLLKVEFWKYAFKICKECDNSVSYWNEIEELKSRVSELEAKLESSENFTNLLRQKIKRAEHPYAVKL